MSVIHYNTVTWYMQVEIGVWYCKPCNYKYYDRMIAIYTNEPDGKIHFMYSVFIVTIKLSQKNEYVTGTDIGFHVVPLLMIVK